MLFKIRETNQYITVQLFAYCKNGDISPDVFSSFETNVLLECELEQESNAYIIDTDSYYHMIDYWEEEIELFNHDEFSEQFGDISESNIDFYLLCES